MTQSQAQARPVVVYDGDCPFCRKQIQRFKTRDLGKAFEYCPRQTEGIDERFPKLAEGDFSTGMRLVHPNGEVSVGADAVYHIARHLQGYKYLAWLYRVPVAHQIARATYAWITAHRMKLAGGCDERCSR
jgi:predicted DCC family thiol-disulfide oxidoreductase YuxK